MFSKIVLRLTTALLSTFIIIGNCQLPKWDSICELPTDITCAQLSKDLERALLLDEGNLFRMRRAFFYSPTAALVLLKVVYNVSFKENTTISDKECGIYLHKDNTSFEDNDTSLTNGSTFSGYGVDISNPSEGLENITDSANESNANLLEFKPMNITYGWTSSGVYTVFHPTVLNMMQAQIPLLALKIIHRTLDQRSPEADTFLWDGSYELPTLHLNMHVTSLSCIPDQDLFKSVLEDFNTLVSIT